MELQKTQSHSIEKRKSSVSFNNMFMSSDQQYEEVNSIDSTDIDLEMKAMHEESVKRISDSLDNIAKMSQIDLPIINEDDSDSISKSGEEPILNRQRGNTKRSTILVQPSVYRKFPITTSHTDETSIVQVRLSNNVVVRNMSCNPLPSKNLLAIEADAYADIIDKLLSQLELIKCTIPTRVDLQWDESYKTMEEKYGSKNFNDFQLSINSSTVEKLQRDRTYIHNVLKNISTNLRLYRHYDYLENEIDSIAKTSEDQHNLGINFEIWSEQLIQLQELIKMEKIEGEIQIKKLLSSVHESGVKLENAIFQCGSQLGYIKKWEQARLDQQKLLLDIQEQMLQDKLSEYSKKEKIDDIVSTELRVFLNNDILRMENEIELWSLQYDEDIDQRQRDIDYFNERIKDISEALEEKYKIRNTRQEFIEKYEQEQLEKAKEIEQLNIIHSAATVIQSVWRGYMVRHELGKYERLWVKLKKRKKLAAKKRKKQKARLKRIEKLKATRIVNKKK